MGSRSIATEFRPIASSDIHARALHRHDETTRARMRLGGQGLQPRNNGATVRVRNATCRS